MTDKIKKKLKNNEFVIGCLMALYSRQSILEQNVEESLECNGKGFNAVDSNFLSNIAKQYQNKGYLTQNQIKAIKPALIKYSKQLSEIDIKSMPVNIDNKEYKNVMLSKDKKKLIITWKCKWGSTEFHKIKDKVKNNLEKSSFNINKKYWEAKLSVENYEKLLNWGFTISTELKYWYDDLMIDNSDGKEINIEITNKIKVTNLNERLRNILIDNLTISNPKFYANERMGYKNYNVDRKLKFYDRISGGLIIPRGYLDDLIDIQIEVSSGSPYESAWIDVRDIKQSKIVWSIYSANYGFTIQAQWSYNGSSALFVEQDTTTGGTPKTVEYDIKCRYVRFKIETAGSADTVTTIAKLRN